MRLSPDLEARILDTPGVVVRDACPAPAGPMTEKVFMQAIIDVARANGWRVMHVFDSRRSPSGFPDLVCVKRLSVLWLECKTATGQPTAAQLAWGEALLDAGQYYRLIRPSDWDEIKAILEAP